MRKKSGKSPFAKLLNYLKQRITILQGSGKDFSAQKGFVLVSGVAVLVFLLKLLLSYSAYGTNDITYWKYFADTIAEHGTFKIYSLVRIYNHPPLISWILKIIRYAALKTGLSFQYVFRLLPITADLLSIFVIWDLLSELKVRTRTFLCIICSLNPINFLVSGFHGNTDLVFIFFVLLTIYFVKEKKNIYAGLFYGVAVCIKIVPLILLPLFFFYFRKKKEKTVFLLFSLLIPFLVCLPYFLNDFQTIFKNVFVYSGIKGIWGIPHLLREIFTISPANSGIKGLSYNAYSFYNRYAIPWLLLLEAGFSKYFMSRKNPKLLEGWFLIFAIFLVFTPGFGVQYLSWLAYFAVITSPFLGTVYLLLGGIFLFRVYTYWGGAIPPYYANSDAAGQWIGFNKLLDIALWVIIFMMLVDFGYRKFYIKEGDSS